MIIQKSSQPEKPSSSQGSFSSASRFRAQSNRLSKTLLTVFVLLAMFAGSSAVYAQGGVFGYFTEGFIYPPQLFGDVKFGPTMVKVIQGQEAFNFYDDALFFDVFARAGLGRLSFRLGYEPRWFQGKRVEADYEYVTRFEFKGLRLGIGGDIVRRRLVSAGVSLDYDWYAPELSSRKIPSKDASTQEGDTVTLTSAVTPLCFGVNAKFNFPVDVFGMIPIVDGSFRTSVMGVGLNDYKIGAGLQLPTTVYGTMAATAGYQNTSIQFNKVNETLGNTVEIGYAGWFINLLYYY